MMAATTRKTRKKTARSFRGLEIANTHSELIGLGNQHSDMKLIEIENPHYSRAHAGATGNSLEDVFDLLEEWPDERRGDTYEVLLKACRMAAQGIFPLLAIRENVRRFLMKQGVLADIEEVPLMTKRSNYHNLGS